MTKRHFRRNRLLVGKKAEDLVRKKADSRRGNRGSRGEVETVDINAIRLYQCRELAESGQLAEAMVVVDAVLEEHPELADAWCFKGWVHLNLAEWTWALEAADRALALDPYNAQAYATRGDALVKLAHPDQALESYDIFLDFRPGTVPVINNLGTALHAMGLHAQGIAELKRAWDMDRSNAAIGSSWVATLDYLDDITWEKNSEARREWADQYRLPWTQHIPDDLRPDKKLTIGYISADFRNHATMSVVFPMIAGLDRSKFRVILYSNTAHEDDWSVGIYNHADRVCRIWGQPDQDVFDQIRADKVDILVDLMGHTADSRMKLLAMKPAPIQISGWGHGGGTGMETMDWVLGDPVSTPVNIRHLHSEKVYDLPCHLTFWAPPGTPDVGPLPAKKNGYVTYGHFGRYSKVSPSVERTWADILLRDQTARLLVKSPSFDSADARTKALERMGYAGVDIKRVELMGTTSRGDHLEAHNRVDICLDTWPLNGGVTVLEALWMGCPVVVLGGGRSFGSRVSLGIIHAMKLHGWIAADTHTYGWLAYSRGRGLDELAQFRATARDRFNASPIGVQNYLNAVMVAYRDIWHKFLEAVHR